MKRTISDEESEWILEHPSECVQQFLNGDNLDRIFGHLIPPLGETLSEEDLTEVFDSLIKTEKGNQNTH
jgi:hypothetical protein